jgi:AcrR family transcriptional regulator
MARAETGLDEKPRDTILRVATSLFGQRSYPATTMRDIAGEVGILAGSLYAHIDGKESLLLEIIEGGISEFIDQVTAAAEAESGPSAKLRAMVKAHVAVVAANPQRTLIVFHQWRYLGADRQVTVRGRRREYENLFRTVVREGIEVGKFSADIDIRIAVFTILGALNWTPEWLSARGSQSIDEIGDRLADNLLGGLEKRPARGRGKAAPR